MGSQLPDTLERVGGYTHTHTHTHIHLKDAVVRADKQVTVGTGAFGRKKG